jgi:hypothetical protein
MAVTMEHLTAVHSAAQTADWWDVLGVTTLAVCWADLTAVLMAALMAGNWAGRWDPHLVAHWADSWGMHLVAYWVVQRAASSGVQLVVATAVTMDASWVVR